jgi:predicted peptidase
VFPLRRRPLPYLVFPPAVSETLSPLIVFLHGNGERGGKKWSRRTLSKLTETGLPQLAAEDRLPTVDGRPFPMTILCPQAKEGWKPHHAEVLGLVDQLIESGVADPDRCYLTGLSIGAFATWEIAARAPTRFAALVPVAGGVPREAAYTRELPVWAFAAGADDQFPAAQAEADFREQRGEGADSTFTIIPGAGHDAGFWNEVYSRSDLYEWLLTQARRP